MTNRNELFILAAQYKASYDAYSTAFQAALRAGVDTSSTEAMKANAPEAHALVLTNLGHQKAIHDLVLALPDLHLFLMGDSDYMVAETEEQAWNLWTSHTGLPRQADDTVRMLADDKPLDCSVDADGNVCERGEDGSTVVTRTAGEWAALLGPGFAFSEDY